ncbi:hypothetical protein [Bifidobacterium callitrichidarum]|uniref:Periplasmic binding protein domain-containing protein n=1 Tax=Bifidobacterium callitrichidarum TaxID=2052941 RepID=A0A2U2NCN6_9BIFI|nr:hypothetical protein [Bifidobacterium callitrichidarum]PWG66794.1 hypothetical protein DF196_00740 [Bifidobacterium callitrichidarum]
MVSARRPATVLTAFAAACAMALSLTSCASDSDRNDTNGDTTITSTSLGAVALFTPSDGITLSQQTPLNKWAKLTPDITDALVDAGFRKGDVSHTTSDSLDKQSRAIQDYVVDHLSSKGETSDSGITITPENTTLLVAPVVEADASTRQYGDYVSQELSTSGDEVTAEGSADADESSDSSSSDSSGSSKDEASADSSDTATDTTADNAQAEAVDRLVSSLKLAKESGMHVVLLGNSIEGYKPDAFAKFSDAQSIGRLQAEKIVAKLQLTKASKDNPKYIEVLLPYTPADAKGTAGDSTFAREAFRGIWQVLGAYYQKGVVKSPSGTLDAKTTENDWQLVAYDASKEGSSAKTLSTRLATDDGADSPTRIDAVLALNDYVASEVVTELDDLGYTGSAADINPQITISGIVGNITGKKDLSRQAVPDPIKSPENDDANTSDGSGSGKDSTATDKAKDAQWPLVTGYGAYVSNIPSVVNGKQWMTGMENRKAFASDIAEACTRLNKGQELESMVSVRNTQVGGVKKVPTINEPLLAVSASNLKATLIDPGYITLADAGL